MTVAKPLLRDTDLAAPGARVYGRYRGRVVLDPRLEGAACAEVDPELFDEVGDTKQVEAAKRVCSRCPARSGCLAYSIEANLTGVVAGGLTTRERFAVRRKRARGAAGRGRALR